MALLKGDKLRFRTLGSGSLPMLKMLEGGSAVFKSGEPLVWDSTSGMDRAATSSAVDVVGFATQDAGGTEGTTMRYIPVTADLLVEAACAGDSEATLALQSSHLGHGSFLKEAAATGSGAWYAQLGTTTNAAWRVVALRDTTGTVHGRVFLRPTSLGVSPRWGGM